VDVETDTVGHESNEDERRTVYGRFVLKEAAGSLGDLGTFILESAVDRGAIAQLIGSPALAQKPQLTHRVSPRFCTNAFHAQPPNLGSSL